MERTQVYLTHEQLCELKNLRPVLAGAKSELIREVIDAFVTDAERSNWKAGMMAAAGLWANRDDLPDFAWVRTEAQGRV